MNEKHIPLKEGEVFFKWCESRIKKNKNVICVTTGPTGSGKSYNDLRKSEIHYENFFNEKFPIENCCFSVEELIKRISDGNLRKGDVLILEEAGVNAGSADWQNKIVKMFNYVLQSFRSMNIILFLNLPVFTMLSKQARQLTHIHFETTKINFKTNMLVSKAKVQQLNQQSGQSYWKYIRSNINGGMKAITRLSYSMPSQYLIKEYEKKKSNFLRELTADFSSELKRKSEEKRVKNENQDYAGLSPRQAQAHDLFLKGLNNKNVAEIMGVSVRCVSAYKMRIEQLKGSRVYSGIPNAPAVLT